MKTKWTRPGPRYEALIQLLRTADTLWNASRALFARWTLSPSQFNILNLLSDHEAGMTQVELSRYLVMHRSNVTGLVDRLESRGLVARRNRPDDRRSYCVGLTAAGRQLVQTILPYYHQAAEDVWNELPVPRVQELAEALAQVSRNAQAAAERLDRDSYGNDAAKSR